MKASKIAIVGGSGRMGMWFAQYFKNKGYEVVLSARNREKLIVAAESLKVGYANNNEEAVKNADLVMISVPITSVTSVIKELAPYFDRNTIVFDITSVKGEIIKTLEEHSLKYGFKAVSTHPMFGPGAKNLRGHTIAVIPIRGSEDSAEKLGRIFSEDGAKLVITDGQTHDRMISTVLGLPHFLNILFGKALLEIPDTLPQIKEFSGTTFALQLLLTECVFREDPELYSEIQMSNKQFLKFLDKMEEIFKELKEVVQKNDKTKFAKLFNIVREKLMQDTNYTTAYDLFYQIIEILKTGQMSKNTPKK
ncbi:MAG: prephenate dehydrogenase/arogenate dehydrogenase family protein [Candidatus Jordarchaeaceae archaeon]